jgi:hypothetical protein
MVSRALLGFAAAILSTASCLAPPPPIALETPYGEVRAESESTAREFARLFEELVPRVRELLPGSQECGVDLWVQEELCVYRHRPRPASVRGFTLIGADSEPCRIHIQEGGQTSWYLTHELVHALIGRDWGPLPGILEEGLADRIAEELNPRHASHIRAHRLLNASAFTHGLGVCIAYSYPEAGRSPRGWKRCLRHSQVQATDPLDPSLVRELLETPRTELRRRWPELPEPFYGIAWLIVSRIVEREGLDGLHQRCRDAREAGQRLIPADALLAAAEVDLDRLDPSFLATCFRPTDTFAAANLQPALFADHLVEVLAPWEERFSASPALRYLRPALLGKDGRELYFRYIGPLRRSFYRSWRSGDRSGESMASPPLPRRMLHP